MSHGFWVRSDSVVGFVSALATILVVSAAAELMFHFLCVSDYRFIKPHVDAVKVLDYSLTNAVLFHIHKVVQISVKNYKANI